MPDVSPLVWAAMYRSTAFCNPARVQATWAYPAVGASSAIVSTIDVSAMRFIELLRHRPRNALVATSADSNEYHHPRARTKPIDSPYIEGPRGVRRRP